MCPAGCAHGFCVTSERAVVEYKCTALYDPTDEIGLAYDDPALEIPWPVERPVLSDRDRRNAPWDDVIRRLTTAQADKYSDLTFQTTGD